MSALEPLAIPLFLTVAALLMIASVLLSQLSGRAGVPIVLLFLAVGVLTGRAGLGQVAFENYRFCFDFGTVALVLILFDGGLNTSLARVRESIAPAVLLATAGVLSTTALVALFARLFDFSWTQGFLLGAIISSTDAAAVFPILRGSGLQVRKRIGAILELESGLNDPMAVILTIALTQSLIEHHMFATARLAEIPIALAIGGACGVAVGFGGRWMLMRVRLPAGGLYPILTLALAFIAFGLPALLRGSGFLGVYVAAMIIGNGPMPYRGGILRVHDSAAWLVQIVMYLLLGLLASASGLIKAVPAGIALGLFLAFVARPASVALCLVPLRYQMREVLYIGWAGLRGAIPIILATYPVLAGVADAHIIFNTIFFVIVVNAIVPGATLRWVTRQLGLESNETPPPPALLEIISTRILTGAEVVSFFINRSAAVCDTAICDLPLPADSSVILLIRNHELIPPRGSTVLSAGDHVYVLCHREDRPLAYLIFGQREAN